MDRVVETLEEYVGCHGTNWQMPMKFGKIMHLTCYVKQASMEM